MSSTTVVMLEKLSTTSFVIILHAVSLINPDIWSFVLFFSHLGDSAPQDLSETNFIVIIALTGPR